MPSLVTLKLMLGPDRMWINYGAGTVRGGGHGYGVINDAGRELLSSLLSRQATTKPSVCNTWFVKKKIHKQTWQHLKSKQ